MLFKEGIDAQYKSYIGIIRFISDSYITLCINDFPNQRSNDVCILIYKDQYENVKLIKENE